MDRTLPSASSHPSPRSPSPCPRPRSRQLALVALSSLLALLALLAGSFACAGDAATRKLLYAPDFHYYEEGEIQTTMQRFAADLAAVDSVLRKDLVTPPEQAQVVARLHDMESAAAELAMTGQASNHPIFDHYLEQLRRDLEAARVGAERVPPDYFMAGRVAGSCFACHRARR